MTDQQTTTAPPRAASGTAPDAAPRRPAPPRQAPARQKQQGWGAPLAILILGMFMAILDTSIVNIAIPNIRRDFGETIDNAQWIATAYALTSGAVVPVSAWLGTRFGLKRVYIVSIAAFTVFSAACGLSTSLIELVVFRILQAIPGGMIPVTCVTMIYQMVPREKIGTAMGLYGLGIVVAPGVGPTLGGYFTEYATWPWIFYVNVPIGIATTFAAVVVLPRQTGQRGRPFDTIGFACVATGLFAFLLALEEGSRWGWTGYRVLGLLFLAVNLLVLWVVIELQVKNPLLNVRVFRYRTFVVSVTLIGIMFVGLFAMLFFLPSFLQNVQLWRPSFTGLIVLPQALVLMVLMPLAGRLYDRLGSRWPATIGMALCGSGLLVLARLNTDIPFQDVILGECLVAAGMGVAFTPLMTGGLSSLPGSLTAFGSAFTTLVQRVSQSFGTALLIALITVDNAQFFADKSALLHGRGADAVPAAQAVTQGGTGDVARLFEIYTNKALTLSYSTAFLVAGVIVLSSAVLGLFLPAGKPSPPPDDGPPVDAAARSGRRRWTRTTKIGTTLVLVVALAQGAFLGTRYLLTDHRWVIVSNAQVDGDRVSISAPVSGTVVEWRIDDGSAVTAGEVVGRIEIQGSFPRARQVVRASGAGTVAQNAVAPGTYVTAGSLLATAYDQATVFVTARVPQQEMHDVQLGAPVDVLLDTGSAAGSVAAVEGATSGVNQLSRDPSINPTNLRYPIYPGPDTDPQNPQPVDQYVPVRIALHGSDVARAVPGEDVTVHIHRP